MTDGTRVPVTVLGLGSMGRALAEAFLAAGHPTTVWNRSPDKAAPLIAAGAIHRSTIEDAVRESSLVVSCLTTFTATQAALAPASAALSGRTVVTLNSGTPAAARGFADWVAGHGARYLAGAVKNVPTAVGKPDTLLYYGGDRTTFDEHVATLRVLGGDTVHLGPEPDLAALYESAVGATLLPALLGFFEGAAVLTARGLTAGSMVPYATKWLQMIESLLPIMADEIDTVDYTKLGSSVGLFHEGIGNEAELGAEAGVDMSWHEPMDDLLRRAVAAGHGEHSITALIEVLRKPTPE
ncbi:NAD(P)-binding domain-containing protein [Nocardia ninae]|uniref:3-hydroxyisobutyrate dehydrogenase n=1 Tax=Nocardia ninae NBRC 108245 TaxID=1210091 RepID=A0A511M8I1_9NOCA|nr:NAD(P)-binding domain-containing protein [Nocardia ninae]GEM36954.1 3-hydroxyisobutyrate dehydrogenase [Nocardia ninae NBRC 108245]